MKPRYKHDCDICIFLGEHDGDDLYYHPGMVMDMVVARFGHEGPDHIRRLSSDPAEPSTVEAVRLAKAAGLISKER